MKIALLGCGSNLQRRVAVEGRGGWDRSELTTVDLEGTHNPDVQCDLNYVPWAWAEDDEYDEVHAYEVLEHLGLQGHYQSFFETFFEIWRILKPGGYLAATVPRWDSLWAWGDPGHTRIINRGTLVFLDQTEYEKQVGKTAMSDFRSTWKGDFNLVYERDFGDNFVFILQAVKPPRLR